MADEVRAAGGVVLRDGRVAVVHRPKYDDWSLPKGKLDPGEGWEEAALREVEEETGLRCRLGAELERSEYRDRKGRPKTVRWWRMEVVDERPLPPGDEVDALEWWPPAEAARRLTYAHDRELVGRLTGERVRLRDGAEVLVRPVTPADKPLFVEGFDHLSDESRYRRFLGVKARLSERELEHLTEVDHRTHEALGAVDPTTGEGLGVARFIRPAPDADAAEAAVVVVDDWQGRGLGWALLSRLADRAAELGVRRFEASLLTDNRAMLALFERLGEVDERERGLGVSHIDVALPTEDRDGLCEALRAAAEGAVALAR